METENDKYLMILANAYSNESFSKEDFYEFIEITGNKLNNGINNFIEKYNIIKESVKKESPEYNAIETLCNNLILESLCIHQYFQNLKGLNECLKTSLDNEMGK